VDFDCEHSRDAAMDRIRKKKSEWLKLISEETKTKNQNMEQQEKHNIREEKEENTRQMKLKKNNEIEKSYVKKREKKVEKYRNTN